MALSIITLNTTDNGVVSRNTINSNFAAILASYPTSAMVVGTTDIQTLTNKTLTSPILSSPSINWGSDATGDMMYRTGGAYTRLGIGSTGQVLTVAAGIPAWNSPSATNTNYIADTGVANAYVATLSPALGAYAAGVLVQFKATNVNTTASTVNVNGLGAKTIKKLDGVTDLVSGDIKAGQIVELEYDGTNFQMLSPVANVVVPGFDGVRLTRLASYTTANNTTENTIFTTTITGGLLSANGMIRTSTPITFSPTVTAVTWIIRLKYGGSTLSTLAITSPAIGSFANALFGEIRTIIMNNAATNSQNVGFYVIGGQASPGGGGTYFGPYGGSPTDVTSAIDTTSNQALTVTIQANSTPNTTSGTFNQTIVETIKNA